MILSTLIPSLHDLLNPLSGNGYQWWSGVGSDFGEITLITGLIVVVWRVRNHLECHVESPKNCHRIGRPVYGTGHRACRKHHKYAAEKGSGITEDDIWLHHDNYKNDMKNIN